MELAHVCNVLAAMDDRCKVLELTQEDTNVLHLAKAEIDEKDGKITQLEYEKKQQQAHIDALEQKLKACIEREAGNEEITLASYNRLNELEEVCARECQMDVPNLRDEIGSEKPDEEE